MIRLRNDHLPMGRTMHHISRTDTIIRQFSDMDCTGKGDEDGAFLVTIPLNNLSLFSPATLVRFAFAFGDEHNENAVTDISDARVVNARGDVLLSDSKGHAINEDMDIALHETATYASNADDEDDDIFIEPDNAISLVMRVSINKKLREDEHWYQRLVVLYELIAPGAVEPAGSTTTVMRPVKLQPRRVVPHA